MVRASAIPAPKHRLLLMRDLIYYRIRVYQDGLVTIAPEGHSGFVVMVEAKSVRICGSKGCKQVFPEPES